MQGRYAEGIEILERPPQASGDAQNFPDALRPYAGMLLVLGLERTDRKAEAYENGMALWDAAPAPLRYYLAYALGRLSSDLSMPDESLTWFRRMLELAPDKKRRLQALTKIIDMPGVNADEAALLLIESPSNASALEFCRALPERSGSLAEYALGYNDYINKRYDSAMERFELASADVAYGEAARYYHAYSAYRLNKNALALSLWSGVALTGVDYPQRSVQRLLSLAGRGMTAAVLKVLKEVAETRDDYPELEADALAGIIRLGGESDASEARNTLYTKHKASNQAATARWDRGWKAWKAGDYNTAYEQWSGGFSPQIRNRELAARLLYWQSRALEKLNSPVAEERVKGELIDLFPAEYYTFLVSPTGGVRSADVPAGYERRSQLEEWGFVTYARLEGAPGDAADDQGETDIPALYRSVRLALWEGDFQSAARGFAVMARAIPARDYAASELLKCYFPRAFEQEVMAASGKTGAEPALIWGVMRQESLYEPDVTSTAGAYGLMQLMPATARGEAKKVSMDQEAFRQPAGNVFLGANHLIGLFARFKEAPLALAAYNAGGTPVARWSGAPIKDMAEWIEDIPYSETRGYVKAVLRNIEAYRLLYSKR
jgi:soluble lytic murein transglycosylase